MLLYILAPPVGGGVLNTDSSGCQAICKVYQPAIKLRRSVEGESEVRLSSLSLLHFDGRPRLIVTPSSPPHDPTFNFSSLLTPLETKSNALSDGNVDERP